ncbi:MAG: hypothetical protein H6621_07940 [Halobacteriovoraceae bacterium]|nr:hypothetical protein [Halobacteriovoraceae bacterium]
MKNIILIFSLLPFLAFGKVCTYNFDADSAKVEFTGYKFTEKVGVKGTFKDFKISAPSKAPSLEGIVGNSSFWLDEMTIDAGKTARNVNIINGLFKEMAGTSIRGVVTNFDKVSKMLTFKLFIGDKTEDVKMVFSHDGERFLAEGKIDLIKIGLKSAFESLSKTCQTFHKGKDGVSKTWSEVALRVTANIKEKCN